MATQTEELVDRATDRLDDLRDATAAALSTDEAPSLRELSRVRRSLDDVEARLAERLDDIGANQAQLAAEVRAENRSTTMPRKLFWMLVGGAAAAIGAYLADPDRGQQRRRQLADETRTRASRAAEQARQTAAAATEQARERATDAAHEAKERATDAADEARERATDAADEARERATDAADEAKERATDAADEARDSVTHAADVAAGKVEGARNEVGPDDVPDDPVLLQQRVKSQVLGHRGDVDDVVVVIGDPGQVILKGVVPDEQSLETLTKAVGEVNGVTNVQSELSTRN